MGKKKKKKEAKTSDNGQFSRLTTAQEETMEMTRAPNFQLQLYPPNFALFVHLIGIILLLQTAYSLNIFSLHQLITANRAQTEM